YRKFCGTHHDLNHRAHRAEGTPPFMQQADLCTRAAIRTAMHAPFVCRSVSVVGEDQAYAHFTRIDMRGCPFQGRSRQGLSISEHDVRPKLRESLLHVKSARVRTQARP